MRHDNRKLDLGKAVCALACACLLAMGPSFASATGSSRAFANEGAEAVAAHIAGEVPLSKDDAVPTAGEVRADGLVFRVQPDGASAALVGWYGEKLPADAVVPALVSSGGDPYEVRAIGLADDEGRCGPLLEGSGIGSLSVPATVSEIAEGALAGCDSLARIVVSDENESYASFDGMLFSKGLSDLLLVPEGKEGAARIPDQTATVPASAFSRCQRLQAVQAGEGCAAYSSRNGILYSKDMKALVACPPGAGGAVVTPEGVEAIGSGAFAGCALSSITVLGDVGSIAPDAFDEAAKPAVVALPEGAGRAVWEAAGFTRFAEPAQPGDTSEPEPGAPEGDGGDGTAPSRAGLSFEVLDDYTLSASWAGGDAPATIEVPASAEVGGASYRVSSIAPAGFSGLPTLESVALPAGLSSIGDAAFAGCSSLANVDVPDGVASIGGRAFEATALSEAWLPESVEAVGSRAFASCASLSRVVALGSPDVAADALAECSGVSVYCPSGSEDSWNPGLPAAGNHVLPYAASLSAEPLALSAGETAQLLEGGGLLVPEPIVASYSYPAKPLSVGADGSVSGKSEGAADVAVALTLDGVELARASRPVEVAPGEADASSPAPEVVSEDRPLLPGSYLAGARAAAAPISVTAPVAVTFGDGNGYDVAKGDASVTSTGKFVNKGSVAVRMSKVECVGNGVDEVLETATPTTLDSQKLFSLYPGSEAAKAVDFGYGITVNSVSIMKGDFKVDPGGSLDCTYRLNLSQATVKKNVADNGQTVKTLANVICTFEPYSFYLKDGRTGATFTAAEVKTHAEDISSKSIASEYYGMYDEFVKGTRSYECKVVWGDGLTYNVNVIGIYHDDKPSGGKAGLTFQFADLLNNTHQMNPDTTNKGGWGSSALRTSMNSGTIWEQVPSDLQGVIETVEKKYCPSRTSTSVNDVVTSKDKLFVASFSELAGPVPSSYTAPWKNALWLSAEGDQYEYWINKGSRGQGNFLPLQKGLLTSSSTPTTWWERSVCPDDDFYFINVHTDGYAGGYHFATSSYGICPCFCL